MSLRCELNVNGGSRRVLIVAKEEETPEHLALRLAAAILFFDGDPALEVGPDDPALADIGFMPDLMVPDGIGGIKVWVECGNVAENKLIKVARRIKDGRLVVLKESVDAGRRQRDVVNAEVRNAEKVDVWAWPREDFARWKAAIQETNYIYGEASGQSLNLVMNDQAFSVDLVSC